MGFLGSRKSGSTPIQKLKRRKDFAGLIEAWREVGDLEDLISGAGVARTQAAERALHELARERGDAAVRPLLEIIGQGDEFTKSIALGALGSTGSNGAVEPLLRVCIDEVSFRLDCARALHALVSSLGGDPVAVKELDRLIGTHDPAGTRFEDVDAALRVLAGALDGMASPELLERLAEIGGSPVPDTPATAATEVHLPQIDPAALPSEFAAFEDHGGSGDELRKKAVGAWNARAFDEALELNEQALGAGLTGTHSAAALASIGQIHLMRGDLEQGIDYLVRCLATRPISAGVAHEAAVRLEVIYDAAGQADLASAMAEVAGSTATPGVVFAFEAAEELRRLVAAQADEPAE